jgi:hypothetical protein
MKNLLITTIGEYNHLNVWLAGEPNFDVAVVSYDNHKESQDLVLKCVWYDTFSTFKYPGIWDLLWDEPRLLRYDYFWMPDEDILLSTEKINEMFYKMKYYNLDLAQPSVEKSDISFPCWEHFIHKENIDIIYSTFVEIMCPCFGRDALGKCLETFKKSQSGWGLDLVWVKLIGDNGNNIAIINNVVAKHTRRIRNGGLYDALTKKRILPSAERKKLMREYNISIIDIRAYD